MDLDSDELVALADKLRSIGVVEFSVGEIHIKFTGGYATPKTMEPQEKAQPAKRPQTTREMIEERWGPTTFPGNS